MFTERRTKLIEKMTAEADHPAAIFVSAREATRNSDVNYEFRQESSFYYLTGFDEPDSVALIRPGTEAPFVMFVRPHDPEMAIWVGPRVGIEGAVENYGADKAYPIEAIEEHLTELLSETETLYYPLGADEELDALILKQMTLRRQNAQRGPRALGDLRDPDPLIGEMRLRKSENEIASLTQAAVVTGQGFERAMRTTRSGLHEYEVQAAMESEFRRLGSRRNGYPSIVASAHDSCILHYTTNRKELVDGDLLLIDAGAEWEYYTADVTRTWPVNGQFTPEQRTIYDVVLRAQHAGIAAAQPNHRFDEIHEASVRVLVEGLTDLKILKGNIEQLIENDSYRPFYMHSTSHWLGMDVHDVGRYRNGEDSINLESGMCLTVEPGLYLDPKNENIPEAYRGIGIRIEDDILITLDGNKNLSSHIPSTPEEIEAIVGHLER
tara:strand:+ start:497 stop:1807 length:1311 start_codon:yes stop_codon:yes gene_type:complete